MTEVVAAVTAAVAEASEASGAAVQAKKAATEVVAESRRRPRWRLSILLHGLPRSLRPAPLLRRGEAKLLAKGIDLAGVAFNAN